MERRYRGWEERRQIIRSIIAQGNPGPLADFQLSESEEADYRARAANVIARFVIGSSTFRGYYRLPTAKPFGLVVGVSAVTSAGAAFLAGYLILSRQGDAPPDPLLAACATVMVAAVGWAVAGWITHRNTVRQNTNAILFARFSQAPFGEAIHRFHKQFGWTLDDPVTSANLADLRRTGEDERIRAAASVTYILNYFESIASGVINGDLDERIVCDNVRGLICSYYDKCAPHIRTSNRLNSKAYENIMKLRMHYREP